MSYPKMCRISRKELQRCRAAKLIQLTEEIFEALPFKDLMEPGFKNEMSKAFDEFFERYARIVKTE